jgi:hypothetical protein
VGAVFKCEKDKSGASYLKTGFAALPDCFVCMPAPEVLSAASLRSAFRRHGKVIFRSDGHSVVKDHQRVNTLHLLWTKGFKKTTFSTELFLRFSNCLQTSLIFLGQGVAVF